MDKQRTTVDINTKETLTFREAAVYTGFSPSYLYKLTGGGRIPHYKPCGKRIFFDRKELDGWLKSSRISTIEEIQASAASRV